MTISERSFAWALEQLKNGLRVQRSGWNGEGMYIVLQKGYPEGIPINTNTAKAIGQPVGLVCKFSPYLLFKTAQGDFVPWVASQTDLLATDWGYHPE